MDHDARLAQQTILLVIVGDAALLAQDTDHEARLRVLPVVVVLELPEEIRRSRLIVVFFLVAREVSDLYGCLCTRDRGLSEAL